MVGGGTPGGIMPGGGRSAIIAVIAAGLGGGANGRIPGGKVNAQGGGTIGGIPGRGGGIGNGAFGILPDLNAAVVLSI